MKTADLIGGELDYWVARAEGHECHLSIGGSCIVTARADGLRFGEKGARGMLFDPSTEWRIGGPIIYRESISTGRRVDYPSGPPKWTAHIDIVFNPKARQACFWGENPLVAAMRCYVDSVFGEEVNP